MDDFDFDGGDLPESKPASTNSPMAGSPGGMGAQQGGAGSYADEIASETIQARFRTFYLDLKQSNNGKFLKLTEKSHGVKRTIMVDAEDVGPFMEALQRLQAKM